MSKQLEEIRKKIDALDDNIHDLLMERADLIMDVAEAKKKANTHTVQPAREAIMIRRLLARHHGPLPEAAIVCIWRELVGAVSLLQTGLKVAVSTVDGNNYAWDMARDYFGSVLPMVRASTPLNAVSSVREGENSFAVLPWPHDGESNPWWSFLVNQSQEERMWIVCALPYGSEEQNFTNIHEKVLVISKTPFSSSGSDHTFLALEADQSVSRARIVEVMKSFDLEALSINSKLGANIGTSSLHFVEVDDYVGEDDERLKKIMKKFEEFNARCTCIGGYPVPPVFDSSKHKPEKKPQFPTAKTKEPKKPAAKSA